MTDLVIISARASQSRDDIQSTVDNNDLSAFLAHYDNKALFALAARTLPERGVPRIERTPQSARSIRMRRAPVRD